MREEAGSSVRLDALASSLPSEYVGLTIHFIAGAGKGQTAVVVEYDAETKWANLSRPLERSETLNAKP